MLDFIMPNYELHITTKGNPNMKKGGQAMNRILICIISLCYAFTLFAEAMANKEAVGILPLFSALLPFFVLIFCKDHLELAFIPFAIDVIIDALRIVFNLSYIFPLSMSSVMALLILALKLMTIGLVFLSLYIEIPTKFIVICANAFFILEMVTTFFIPLLEDGFYSVAHININFFTNLMIFYILACMIEQQPFSGLKPIPIIAAVLLCTAIVLCLLLFNQSYISTCPNCDGEGDIFSYSECYNCDGNGTLWGDTCNKCDGKGTVLSQRECYICNGSGKIDSKD